MALGGDHDPSGSRATTSPEPTRPLKRKPALRTVMMASPLALRRTSGGMTLSGPNACLGSMKEARMRLAFLDSERRLAGTGLLNLAISSSFVVVVVYRMSMRKLEEAVVGATDENSTSEDWQRILDVCDQVNTLRDIDGPREAVGLLQRRLAHRSVNVQLYALTLAESLSKNCGSKMHREIASRAFTQALLRLASDRTTHAAVKSRIVELMEEWTRDYRTDPSLGFMGEAFVELQNPNLQPPHKPQKREITEQDRRKEEEELQMALAMSLHEEPVPVSQPAAAAQTGAQAVGTGQGEMTSAATVSRVRALYDFTPSEAGELEFRRGDIIQVLDSVYKDWWRGSLQGATGIFPVNYVQAVPDPTPEELRREAEDEARVFSEARNIEKLLSLLSEGDNANIADNESLQNTYHTTLAIRPKLVRLIDKYARRKDDLVGLNEKFLKARRDYDTLMESSMAQYSRYAGGGYYGGDAGAYRPSQTPAQPFQSPQGPYQGQPNQGQQGPPSQGQQGPPSQGQQGQGQEQGQGQGQGQAYYPPRNGGQEGGHNQGPYLVW